MCLYDALRALAAADLRDSLENRKFDRVLVARPLSEYAIASPGGAASNRRGAVEVDHHSVFLQVPTSPK